MELLAKLDKIMTLIEEYLIAGLLILMTAVISWAVFTRFILNDSSSWAEEAARYLSIWSVFIGASLGARRGAHIGIEAFSLALPKKIQPYVAVVTTLICISFCCAISYIGYDYVMRLAQTGQLSAAMRIPIVWAYAAVPVGCLLMTVRYLIILAEQIAKLRASSADGERGEAING